MNQAITVGGLLTLLAIVAGLAIAAFGFIEWLASGMSDNISAGALAGKRGGFLFALGAAIIVGAALLGGCAEAPPTHVKTIEVKVPVAIQPIRPEQIPAAPAPLGPRPPTLQQAADLALAGWCEAVAYIIRADPLLHISAGQAPGAPLNYPECRKH